VFKNTNVMKALILTLALLTSTTLALVAATNDGLPFASVLEKVQARGLDVKDVVYTEGTLFFTAVDAEHGLELWKSDGTEEGTVLIRDINPGTPPSDIMTLVYMDGNLFFMANDGTRGMEPWMSDGTADGTFPIHDPFRNKMTNTNTASVAY
jgi:ELWxxDGT repeat protein